MGALAAADFAGDPVGIAISTRAICGSGLCSRSAPFGDRGSAISITAAATHTTAAVAAGLPVHHFARADLLRLDLSTCGCFFMRIDRFTGIRVSLKFLTPDSTDWKWRTTEQTGYLSEADRRLAATSGGNFG